jgi:hypothetical protein
MSKTKFVEINETHRLLQYTFSTSTIIAVSEMTKEIRAGVRTRIIALPELLLFALLPHSNMESYAWNLNM